MNLKENKQEYVNKMVEYVKKFPDKINKVVVFGKAVNDEVDDSDSLDIAVGLVDEKDATNYDLLGDLLSYLGDIVDKETCSLYPISSKVLSTYTMTLIEGGLTVYEVN